jgi:hypothetical protein
MTKGIQHTAYKILFFFLLYHGAELIIMSLLERLPDRESIIILSPPN